MFNESLSQVAVTAFTGNGATASHSRVFVVCGCPIIVSLFIKQCNTRVVPCNNPL